MAETLSHPEHLNLRVDREGEVPIYAQIKKQIEDMIHSGELKAGDLLPSEPNIAKALGVSKMTVRQAISELTAEGLLERHKGRGTFVCERKVSIRLPYFISYTQDMRRRGYSPRTKVLGIEEVAASARIARTLDVEPNAPLIHMTLLRFADELPMLLENVLVIKDRVPGFAQAQREYSSRYDLYEKKYQIRPTRAEQTLEAVILTPDEAYHLGVPGGSPALLMESLLRDQDDRPIELCKSIYRGDRYKVYFERIRRDYDG